MHIYIYMSTHVCIHVHRHRFIYVYTYIDTNRYTRIHTYVVGARGSSPNSERQQPPTSRRRPLARVWKFLLCRRAPSSSTCIVSIVLISYSIE